MRRICSHEAAALQLHALASPSRPELALCVCHSDFWVLEKDDANRRYVIAPASCSPPRMPWATRQVRINWHGGGTTAYTLVDYLSLPQPRTAHPFAALKQLIPGHGHKLDPSHKPKPEERRAFIDEIMAGTVDVPAEDVESIDWWCGKISDEGVGLRIDSRGRRASLVTPRRRAPKNFSQGLHTHTSQL